MLEKGEQNVLEKGEQNVLEESRMCWRKKTIMW